jgi:cell wall-associated NlpC family hydrolase
MSGAFYFDDPEARARLKAALAAWEGTPFRHRQGRRGAGADCAHFVAAVMAEAGAIPAGRTRWPDYGRGWHLDGRRELLMEELLHQYGSALERISPDGPYCDGDIIVSRFGAVNGAHLSIYCEGRLWHALEAFGVCASRYEEFEGRWSWRERVSAVFRVKTNGHL